MYFTTHKTAPLGATKSWKSIVNVLHMLDVVSSENREKTLRFVLTFHGQATDRLPTHYQQLADCRPTGFLGSSSSQLPRGLLSPPTKIPPQQLPWNLFWFTKAPSAILLLPHWMQSNWNLLKNCKGKCTRQRRPSSCLTRTRIQTVTVHGTAWATLKFNMQRNICHLSYL